jgi:hypothetical protein
MCHAECLSGDPSRDDVGVVTVGDCGKRPGALDARLDEYLAIKAATADLLAVELRAESAEGLGILVDHCYVVTDAFQCQRKTGTHPATTHDHDMHAVTPGRIVRGCPGICEPNLAPMRPLCSLARHPAVRFLGVEARDCGQEDPCW